MLLFELKIFCNISFRKIYIGNEVIMLLYLEIIEDCAELVLHETADLEKYGAAEDR
jgi:hypothetical protein